MTTLSETIQNEVAKRIQAEVPLVERPFAVLAEELSVSESTLLDLLNEWQDLGKLREISAVLEGSALGYDSALVAGKVPEHRVDAVAEIVNLHPTVTHNYLRNHDYNLWFTIATPKDTMGIEPTLTLLTKETGIPFFSMRRTMTFKIGVRFDLETKRSETAVVEYEAPPPARFFSAQEKEYFRALQTPLPLVECPFAALATRYRVDVSELLAFAHSHQKGAIRRYVGTFRHRHLGVKGNAMVVWSVPQDRLEIIGKTLAATPEVTHCYAREAIPDFPYTLYTMLHGPDQASCLELAKRMAESVGVECYLPLFSSREFKKTRLRYFLPELDAWWHARQSKPVARSTVHTMEVRP